MEYNYNNGSEWRRWDLHVHTKGTNKNDQFSSATFDTFCEELFRKALDNNIHAIGVTDYFSIDNYNKVKEYINNGALAQSELFSEEEKGKIQNIYLLPNVELRMLPVTDSGRLVNIHCIFNPQYVSSLEHDFFSQLKHRSFSMTREGIIRLGKDMSQSSNDEQAYKLGVNNFNVEISALEELLKQNRSLRENTITVVSNSNQDGASAMQKHYDLFESETGCLDSTRKAIYMLSDCIFSSNVSDREFFSGTKKTSDGKFISPATVISNCGSLKPCIHGSDAHKEDKLFMPDNNRYCWIKADLSFSGLKQVICEPLERVRIQMDHPDNKKSYNVIDKVRFVNPLDKVTFSTSEIGFNSGLNAIIGGKSSGKSLLLHMIASQIGDKSDRKIYDDVIDGSSIEIFYRDNPSVKREVSDARIIEFLPQLYIEKLVRNPEEKGTTDRSFNSFIKRLISQDDTIKGIIDAAQENISLAITNIDSKITEWSRLDESLSVAKEERMKLGDKSSIENEINNIDKRIAELSKSAGWTEDEKVKYDEVTANIKTKNTSIQSKQITNNELERYKIHINGICLPQINASLKYSTTDEPASVIISSSASNIEYQIIKLINSEILEIDKIIKQHADEIASLQSEIDENRASIQHLIDKNTVQTEIIKLEKEKSDESEKIANIQEKDSQLSLIRGQIQQLNFSGHCKEISDAYYKLSEDLNDAIASKWDKRETRLSITSKANFKSSVFDNAISSVVNMSGYLQNQISKTIFNANNFIYEKDLYPSTIADLVSIAIREKDRFVNFKKDKTTKEFLAAILKDCYTIDYDVEKGGDSLHKMSEGKKGIVILQLYLSLSGADCPILIDQPEDNLDNRTVYQELNDYIKQCKIKRQIIMVSHNANLVVNTDAENIIVANQGGEDGKENKEFKFEYVNGSLEKSFYINDESLTGRTNIGVLYMQGIREHVCEILEGGVDAFRKREGKYHINR